MLVEARLQCGRRDLRHPASRLNRSWRRATVAESYIPGGYQYRSELGSTGSQGRVSLPERLQILALALELEGRRRSLIKQAGKNFDRGTGRSKDSRRSGSSNFIMGATPSWRELLHWEI